MTEYVVVTVVSSVDDAEAQALAEGVAAALNVPVRQVLVMDGGATISVIEVDND